MIHLALTFKYTQLLSLIFLVCKLFTERRIRILGFQQHTQLYLFVYLLRFTRPCFLWFSLYNVER
jgi:hypothetical protein